jgi:hypothetical protein
LIHLLNHHTFSIATSIETSKSYDNLFLKWENWCSQGDAIAIAISPSLNDLVQPVPGPLPVMGGAASAFVFSRRLRRRRKVVLRHNSNPLLEALQG